MKKKILSCFILLLILIGCSGIQTQTAQNIALQIVAQRIGYQVAQNNPSIVPQAELIAKGILAGNTADLQKIALQAAISALTAQFPDDPLLAADIQLIVVGLNLNLPSATFSTADLAPLINAFLNGMAVANK
jgi:hypothetical protein